jgi:hypothetical protein
MIRARLLVWMIAVVALLAPPAMTRRPSPVRIVTRPSMQRVPAAP